MKTEELINQFLQKTLNGIDATVSFMSAQLPDYINQLLMWRAVESFIYFIVAICLLFFSFKWNKREFSDLRLKDQNDMPFIPARVCSAFSFCIALIIVFCCFDWLQIIIAPKVWLIEYAAHLVRCK